MSKLIKKTSPVVKMTLKKIRLFSTTGIIPVFLILITLAGLFSPVAQVSAQSTGGTCTRTYRLSDGSTRVDIQQKNSAEECPSFVSLGAGGSITSVFTPYSDINPDPNPGSTVKTTEIVPPPSSTANNKFQRDIDNGCTAYPPTWFKGCLLKVFYYTYFQIPNLLLTLSANFFNAMVSVAIMSTLKAGSHFLPEAWGTVRDLSNIFFILILLYVAIQTILGLGHEAKKIVVWVIIMGLLINFSMFFTKVVIDSSNILALVFYNKLKVDPDRQKSYDQITNSSQKEKDISGEIVKAFNPTKLLSEESLNKMKRISILGTDIMQKEELPFGLTLGLMFIAGSIMFVAAFAFWVAGFAFLARLLELWFLIIFSPFAFMSYALPKLAGIDYLGWDAWSKRLVKTSFMAPIFMFFMYLIFQILKASADLKNILTGEGFIPYVLSIVFPAIVSIFLLLKAVKFAKEGAGKLGEMASSAGKLVGGLALGAATGGTAMAMRATVGRAGSAVANSEWAKRREAQGKFGSGVFRSAAKSIGSGSFDIRGSALGKSFASASGMNLGEAKKGGFTQARKEQVNKRQKRAEELEVGEDEELKQNLNNVQRDLQNLLNANSAELSELDKLITKKRETLRDTTARFGGGTAEAKQAGLDLQNVQDRKKALKDGKDYLGDKDLAGNVTGANAKNYSDRNAGTYVDAAGVTRTRTINHMEDVEIVEAKHAIETENRERKWNYAEAEQTRWGRIKGFALSGGAYTRNTAREAAHKIRMEAKIESSGDNKSHGKSGGGHGGGGGHPPATPAHPPTPAPAGVGGGHGHP